MSTAITRCCCLLTCTLFALVSIVPTASDAFASSYEKDYGVTVINENLWEAWAWANVWGKTQGRAFAKVGSHVKDTGWFTSDCRTSSVIGPRTQVFESWSKIK